ncbi:MAG: hypothetical protein JNK29_09055 [Anaerolineales bacterium]|nr:hypothetical protein [Anaerolineales bacterium]
MKKASRKPPKPAQPEWLQWWPVAVLLLGVAGLAWAASRPAAPVGPPAATPRTLGGVANCARQPAFAAAAGFSPNAALTTSDDRRMGLVLMEALADGRLQQYQHETWTLAGWLGGLVLTESGDVYVIPAPRVSLWDNPPEKSTILYRVDGQSGAMAAALTLPAAQPPAAANPFGLLGLTYDCETHSLYVSSVAGSSRSAEVGRLFRVDLSGAAPKLAAQLDGVDAIGVGVFNGAQGKRLYFGSARTSEVRSVALDAAGNFTGAPRLEFSLAEHDPRGDDKARRLSFDQSGGLQVEGLKFNFNLVATSEHRQNRYRYRYDPAADSWTFLDVTPVVKGGN